MSQGRRRSSAAPAAGRRGSKANPQREIRALFAEIENAQQELYSKAGDRVMASYITGEIDAVEASLQAEVDLLQEEVARMQAEQDMQDQAEDEQQISHLNELRRRHVLYHTRLREETASDAERIRSLEDGAAELRAHILKCENDIAVLKRYLNPRRSDTSGDEAGTPMRARGQSITFHATAPRARKMVQTATVLRRGEGAWGRATACLSGDVRETVAFDTPEGVMAYVGRGGHAARRRSSSSSLTAPPGPAQFAAMHAALSGGGGEVVGGASPVVSGTSNSNSNSSSGGPASVWRVSEHLRYMVDPVIQRPLWDPCVVRQLMKDLRTLWTHHADHRRWDETLPLQMLTYEFSEAILWLDTELVMQREGTVGSSAPQASWRVIGDIDAFEAEYSSAQHSTLRLADGAVYEPAGAAYGAQWWRRTGSFDCDFLIRYDIMSAIESLSETPAANTVLWLPSAEDMAEALPVPVRGTPRMREAMLPPMPEGGVYHTALWVRHFMINTLPDAPSMPSSATVTPMLGGAGAGGAAAGTMPTMALSPMGPSAVAPPPYPISPHLGGRMADASTATPRLSVDRSPATGAADIPNPLGVFTWDGPLDLVQTLPSPTVVEYLATRPWEAVLDSSGAQGHDVRGWFAKPLVAPHADLFAELRDITCCDELLSALTEVLTWEPLPFLEVRAHTLDACRADDVTLSLTVASDLVPPRTVTAVGMVPALVELPAERDFIKTLEDPSLLSVNTAASFEGDPARAIADAYGQLDAENLLFVFATVRVPKEKAAQQQGGGSRGPTPPPTPLRESPTEAQAARGVSRAFDGLLRGTAAASQRRRSRPDTTAPLREVVGHLAVNVVVDTAAEGATGTPGAQPLQPPTAAEEPTCVVLGINDRGGACGSAVVDLGPVAHTHAAVAADVEVDGQPAGGGGDEAVVRRQLTTALHDAANAAGWAPAGPPPSAIFVTYPEAARVSSHTLSYLAKDAFDTFFGFSSDSQGNAFMVGTSGSAIRLTLLWLSHGASISQHFVDPYIALDPGTAGAGTHEITTGDTHVIKTIDGAPAAQVFNTWCGGALDDEMAVVRRGEGHGGDVYIEKALSVYLQIDTVYMNARRSSVVAPLAITAGGGLLLAEQVAMKSTLECRKLGDVGAAVAGVLRGEMRGGVEGPATHGVALFLPHRYSMLPKSRRDDMHANIRQHVGGTGDAHVAAVFSHTRLGAVDPKAQWCLSSALPLVLVVSCRRQSHSPAQRKVPPPVLKIRAYDDDGVVGEATLTLTTRLLLQASVGVAGMATRQPVNGVFPEAEDYQADGEGMEITLALRLADESVVCPPTEHPSLVLKLRTLRRRLLPPHVNDQRVWRAVIEKGVPRVARVRCVRAGVSCQSQVCITTAEAKEFLEMQVVYWAPSRTCYLLKLSGDTRVIADLTTPPPAFRHSEVPSIPKEKHLCFKCGLTSLHAMGDGFVYHQATGRLFCSGCVYRARVVLLQRLRRPCAHNLASLVSDTVFAVAHGQHDEKPTATFALPDIHTTQTSQLEGLTPHPSPEKYAYLFHGGESLHDPLFDMKAALLPQLRPFLGYLSRAVQSLYCGGNDDDRFIPRVHYYRTVNIATWRACSVHSVVAWPSFAFWSEVDARDGAPMQSAMTGKAGGGAAAGNAVENKDTKLVVMQPLKHCLMAAHTRNPRTPAVLLPPASVYKVVRVERDATYLEEIGASDAAAMLRKRAVLAAERIDVERLLALGLPGGMLS